MMSTLRILFSFLKFSIGRDLLFRFDAVGRIGMDLIYSITSISFYWIVFSHTDTLGGWSFHTSLIMIGAFTVVDAIHMTFFADGMWKLLDDINTGSFDYSLVRPISPLLFIFRSMSLPSFCNLLTALGVLVWAFSQSPLHFAWSEIGIFALLVLNGAYLFFLLRMLTTIPSFWTQGREVAECFFYMYPLVETPETVYPTWLRRILLTVLPLSMVASFPVRVLTDGLNVKTALHATLVSAAFTIVMYFLWKRGVRAYSSASS